MCKLPRNSNPRGATAAHRRGAVRLTAFAALSLVAAAPALAQGSPELSLQALLRFQGQPANGMFEIRYRFYETATGGSTLGQTSNQTTTVANGLLNARIAPDALFDVFLCPPDSPNCCPPNLAPVCLGGRMFDRIWVEIDIRPIGSTVFTTLQPRQELLPSAFSVLAMHAAAADKVTLPYDELANTSGPLWGLTQQSATAGAARFEVANPGSAAAAMEVVTNGSGPAIEAINSGSGPAAILDGDLQLIGGDVRVDLGDILLRIGRLRRYYVQGAPQPDPIDPAGYAYISTSGAVLSGTPNVSCMWNASAQRYEVALAGMSYTSADYVANVTVVDGAAPQFATTTSSAGKLIVTIWDLSGARIQSDFQLVILKPTN